LHKQISPLINTDDTEKERLSCRHIHAQKTLDLISVISVNQW